MSKRLVFVSVAMLAVVVAGYFYLQSNVDKLAPLAKANLARRGFDFTYTAVAKNESGLGLVLKDVNLHAAGSAFAFSAKSIKATLLFAVALPPLKINVNVLQPELALAPTPRTPGGAETPPPVSKRSFLLVLGNALLKITGLDISLNEGKAGPLSASGILGSIQLRDLKIGGEGIEHARISHELLFQELAGVPFLSKILSGVHWTGKSFLNNNVYTGTDQRLAAGPFVMILNTSYKLGQGDWSAKFSIPPTSLSLASNAINAQSLSWLRNIDGSMEMDISANGTGRHFVTEGKIAAKNIHATIDTEDSRGEIFSNTEIRLANNLPTGNFALDLGRVEIQEGDTFFKSRGTPLILEGEFKGEGHLAKIVRAEATFKNMKLSGSGTVDTETPHAAVLSAKLASTSLKGWDEFFPKYSSMPVGGTVESDGSFSGPLFDWKAGKLEVSLTAAKLRVPMLSDWFPSAKTIVIDGMSNINLTGHLVYENHLARQLTTHAALDFKDSEISLGESFKKSPGTPLSLDFNLSGGKTIEAKNINLKGFGGSITGSGNADFTSNVPRGSFEFRVASINSEQLLSAMSPPGSGQDKILSGRLSGETNLKFSGRDIKTIINSLTGTGRLSLLDGRITPIQFMEKPNEVLSKIPELSRALSHSPNEEKLTQLTAKFSVADRKVTSTDLFLQNPFFEVNGTDCTLDFDDNVSAKVTWFPKSGLVPKEILALVDAEKRKVGIPLSIDGQFRNPTIVADTTQIESRLKELATTKFKEQVEKRIQGGLGHTFK